MIQPVSAAPAAARLPQANMLSQSRKKDIERLVHEVDDFEEKLRTVASFGPDELDAYLDVYNWDEGFAIPTAIAEHPACDLALALRLFWLAEGLAWYTGDFLPQREPDEWAVFCKLLTEGILSGRYPLGQLDFDPGLDRIELYKLGETDVPEVLYRPVVGKRRPDSPPEPGAV